MAVENVACPHCGQMAFATVPMGQLLIRVMKSSIGWMKENNCNLQHCKCSSCGKKFYAETK